MSIGEGGLWINADFFGDGQMTFPHEFGHAVGNLTLLMRILTGFAGLLHPFAGTEDTSGCGDPCRENVHSLDDRTADVVGDFCRDTPATPMNFQCGPPTGADCRQTNWGTTDYTNISKYNLYS